MSGDEQRRVITDARTMRAVAHPVRIALLETLAVEGELTASRAAELLGDTPGNMSWHLQTLAKYGFVEETGGGKGRSRPWRRVQGSNSFETDVPDPEAAAAGEALESSLLARHVQRLRDWWAVRRTYPDRWRRAAFMNDSVMYVTAAELRAISEEIAGIVDRYRDRRSDPATRPKSALPVHLVALGHPLPPGSPPGGGELSR